jgi:hypothetical protein
MNDTPRPARRRNIVIGYCVNIGIFLIVNALYWLLVEGRLDLAFQTPIAPLAFAGAGLVVLIPAVVTSVLSLRTGSKRRWIFITHGLLPIYHAMCFIGGKWIMGIEGSLAH